MDDFGGRAAVVTGAGSGIGRGLCEALADAGARVVAADLDVGAAERTADTVGGQAVAVDVADASSVDALADVAFALGPVDVVFLNAGVFAGGWLWESTDEEWDWALGVNVRGIVHGIRSFVPRMRAQATDGHVVITASLAGIVTAPMSGVYCTTKFAAVALAECLHHDLSLQDGNRIAVSVVVPGAVRTAIASRSGPSGGGRASAVAVRTALAEATAAGLDPREAATRILDGVRAGDFYVPTGPGFDPLVGTHNATRLARRPPELQTYD
jgi:NAD(P)-dependent dehydrogenase (short-subunit alcohol dehydrogenase family)